MAEISFRGMYGEDVRVKEGEALLFIRPKAQYRVRIDRIEDGHVWLEAKDKDGRRRRDDSVVSCQRKINPLFIRSIVKHKRGNRVLREYTPY